MNKYLLIFCLMNGLASTGWASTAFQNLTTDDLKKINNDLSANFSHRSVTGAASLGVAFGLEAVAIVGSTNTPNLSEVSVASGGGELKSIATAGVLLAASIPFGITFEYMLLPSLNASGITLSGNSMGVRWLMNDLIPILPVNLALRLNSSNAKFGFSQNINSVNGSVNSQTGVNEVSLYLSPKLPVVEPYVGIGLLTGQGKMDFTGTGTIFNSTVTTGNSAQTNLSSTKMVAGVSIWLPFLSLGVEYVNQFGTSGYGAKFGISF